MPGIKLILLTSILAISACTEPPKEVKTVRLVRAMQIGDAKALTGRHFPGRAKAADEINLAFDVRGKLNKRPVKVGDNIAKGQLIASLDPRDFISTTKEKRAAYQNAKANFNRAKELIKKSFISQAEYDRFNAATRMASAELDKAMKAQSDAILKAPFSGYISELYVENFQAVQAKQKIARLVNITQIEMIINIPESMISLAPHAENISIVFDAFPNHKIPAEIKEIGKEASKTTRTYPVTLVMNQPKGIKILPGMSGNATGHVKQTVKGNSTAIKGIKIPASATYSPKNDGKSYVWLINPKTNTVHQQAVSLGKISNTGINVSEGLSSGDWIATAGVHYLNEGQEIKIMQTKGQ